MIRSSVNLDCFISVSLKVTDSTHFWRKFRGSGQITSAQPSSDRGRDNPSAFAVFRLMVSVALRPFRLAFDAYFDRSLCRRGFQISDNALTAASSAFRSMTLGSNRSGPQRRIFSCSG
jgi:hypothetical protein